MSFKIGFICDILFFKIMITIFSVKWPIINMHLDVSLIEQTKCFVNIGELELSINNPIKNWT